MGVIHKIRGPAMIASALAMLAAPAAFAAEEPSAVQLDNRIKRLENIVNSGQLADIVQQLNSLSEEIRQLRGEVETQTHRLEELRQRQRNLYGDLDRRIRELEVAARRPATEESGDGDGDAATGAGAATQTASAGGSVAEAGGEATDTAASADMDEPVEPRDPEAERKAYDVAFQLLREGRYDEAASEFGQFLQDFPDGPYADNARYWLGEARYVTRNFEPALKAFRAVIEQHPGSAKVPDARLKLGYTLYEMGRLDEAREVLRTVIKQHPDSAVARLAEERLVRIKNEGN